MYRTDGGTVDAELIRPRSWIKSVGIEAGKLLPMNIEELQVKGSALVTAIDDCPEIAGSSQPAASARELGSVVTARFITREVHTLARVEILGPDGQIEKLEGTTIHPIWSLDRDDWVALGELTEGEQLQCQDGPAIVLSVQLLRSSATVYNIEVHGEHVYEVGKLCLLAHNSCYDELVDGARLLYPKKAFKTELHHITPKYLGGATNGPMSKIDGAYHQLITNEFRSLWPYGGVKPSSAELTRIMSEVYRKLPLP